MTIKSILDVEITLDPPEPPLMKDYADRNIGRRPEDMWGREIRAGDLFRLRGKSDWHPMLRLTSMLVRLTPPWSDGTTHVGRRSNASGARSDAVWQWGLAERWEILTRGNPADPVASFFEAPRDADGSPVLGERALECFKPDQLRYPCGTVVELGDRVTQLIDPTGDVEIVTARRFAEKSIRVSGRHGVDWEIAVARMLFIYRAPERKAAVGGVVVLPPMDNDGASSAEAQMVMPPHIARQDVEYDGLAVRVDSWGGTPEDVPDGVRVLPDVRETRAITGADVVVDLWGSGDPWISDAEHGGFGVALLFAGKVETIRIGDDELLAEKGLMDRGLPKRKAIAQAFRSVLIRKAKELGARATGKAK